jgi:benzodiazapine receptor
MANTYKLAVSIILCQLAGAIGSFFTMPVIASWYVFLNKPSFTPPGYVIGAIWVVLFFLMGIALYLVWAKNWEIKIAAQYRGRKVWNRFSQKLLTGSWRNANVILIFAAQLILNILWSVIFFGFKSPGAAFFELIMLWVAIVYAIVNFYRVSKPAGYLLIPYLLWVTFAGYLNYLIWQMNW